MAELKKIDGKTEYEILGLCNHSIKLGGSGAKFVPNLNHSFFDDEMYFNINREDVKVDTEKETHEKGNISLVIGDEIEEYFIDEDRLKWNTILNKRPDSRFIKYKLKFSKGIYFDYQPFCHEEWYKGYKGCSTLEEFITLAGRKEDVEGSYAVYCGKRNNKYQTGKLFHIYRPLIKCSEGKSKEVLNTYGNLFIESTSDTEADLTVEIPENVYNSKEQYSKYYIDPNLGYATQGASVYTSSPIWACQNADCIAGSAGTGVSLKTFVTRVSDANIHVAWYTRGSDNLPETRNDDNTISVTASGWQSASISPSIVSGTYYHPAVCKPGTSIGLHYDASSGNRSWYNGSNTMPADNPTASNDTWNYSIYLEYSEASSVSIPVISHHLRQQGVQ